MPDDATSPVVISEHIEGIPLYLIPKAVADQIKKKGYSVFQIHVSRKFHHRYTVIVETFDEHSKRVNQETNTQKEGEGHG